MTRKSVLLLLIGWALGIGTANGAVIALLPSGAVVSPGDSVALDLTVSALGGGSVGDFDVDLTFDPAVLTFAGVTLAPSLGNPALFEAIDFTLGLTDPGELNIAELSLLSAAALAGLQSDPVLLATVQFQVGAIPPGATTLIQIARVNALGDANGVAIAVSSLSPSTLTGRTAVVPEPALAILFVGGASAAIRRIIESRCALAPRDDKGLEAPPDRPSPRMKKESGVTHSTRGGKLDRCVDTDRAQSARRTCQRSIHRRGSRSAADIMSSVDMSALNIPSWKSYDVLRACLGAVDLLKRGHSPKLLLTPPPPAHLHAWPSLLRRSASDLIRRSSRSRRHPAVSCECVARPSCAAGAR
jgi:hypothetical protein